MAKFKVDLARVEYKSCVVFVEADNEDDAYDIAWNQRDQDWKLVEADEFTNGIVEA